MKNKIAMIAGVALCFLCFCVGKDNNPYKDPSRVAVSIEPSGFFFGDTISIFHTFTFYIHTRLPDEVGYISVHAENNYLWPSADTILKPEEIVSFPVPLQVSFRDTGKNQLRITAFYPEGDTIINYSRTIYAFSPLHQQDIITSFGETVQLKTVPVTDPVDFYIWEFDGDNRPVIAETCSTTLHLAHFGPFTNGMLYARKGTITSPSVPFTVSLTSRNAPRIECINDSVSADGNRVFTGNSLFMLRLKITDNGSEIESAIIDDSEFDKIDSRNKIYMEEFRKVDTLTQPLRTIVKLTNNAKKSVIDTFWIHYSSSIEANDKPVIDITIPEKDTVVTRELSFAIKGSVKNCYTYDTLYLYIRINGTAQSEYLTVAGPEFPWLQEISLSRGVNRIGITAFRSPDFFLDTIAHSSIVIVSDPNASDKIKPVISSVSSEDMLIGDTYFTDDSKITLDITAYDNETGIESVTIDGTAASPGDNSITFTGEVELTHRKNGNEIVIAARDYAGNTTSYTFVAYYNHLPGIDEIPSFKCLNAGETYTERFDIDDDDDDSVTGSVTIGTPVKDTVIGLNDGAFSWTPSLRDTGALTSITIQLYDGYKSVNAGNYKVEVRSDCGNNQDSARFTTSEHDFPDTLRVGRDTLRIRLAIDKPGSQRTFLFNVRVVESGKRILDNTTNNSLAWIPEIGDTGEQTLEITVSSGNYFTDTLTPTMTIYRPIPPVSATFTEASKTRPESVAACSIDVSLSRAGTKTITLPYYILDTKTTADNSDYIFPQPSTVSFAPGQTNAAIILPITNDTIVEQDEKLVVYLDFSSTNIRPGSITEFMYIIENDDSAALSPETYMEFGSTSYYTEEKSCTLSIPLRLSKRASGSVYAFVGAGGSATSGKDYNLLTKSVVFNAGDSVRNVSLEIIDDNECEQDNETIDLRITEVSGVSKGADSSCTCTILKNDESYCQESVALIVRNGNRYDIDEMIKDTLTAAGYEVTFYTDNKVSEAVAANPDLIILSQSINGNDAAEYLAESTIPILCANMDDYAALGLAANDNFGTASLNSIDLVDSTLFDLHGLPFNVRITLSLFDFPWLRPADDAVKVAIARNGDAVIVAYDKNARLANGKTSPGRRVAFCIGEYKNSSDSIPHRNPWWTIFNAAAVWCIGN